ncbi:hypothetical protein [Microscilla marina]|uniref:Uncharacterized protein n=1 Tax=Microscilla marina ATCC 23134 TaxID=313606 RepID=A1ZXP9_MICM2|nr:hypothetical protein [Microscilla marina]EAY24828.1 hypothetical protein M23134_06720 [Microscilla marina ATCC 23134]
MEHKQAQNEQDQTSQNQVPQQQRRTNDSHKSKHKTHKAKQDPVPSKYRNKASLNNAVVQRKEEEEAIKARGKTAQHEIRIDKISKTLTVAVVDVVQPNDSPWVYAVTYYPDMSPIDGLRKIYLYNSPYNQVMLSEYGMKPKFSANMKTFEEFWLKHKAGLQTGQGYDWNIDPGQRVFINVNSIGLQQFVEIVKSQKDDRYRKATPFEVWLRKHVDLNAWDDLVNMAYDDAVQMLLPPAGKDPDGEPKKVIYPLDAVNRNKAPEEKYNKMYYGEDIYDEDKIQGTIVNSHFVFNDGYVPSNIKGFYRSILGRTDNSEVKYLYYPVTHLKSSYKYIHYLYKVKQTQAGKISRKQIMVPANLVKKQSN